MRGRASTSAPGGGEKQFSSWLGLSPGSKVSGGKRLSGKTKPSANRAAAAFRMAACSLTNSKTALGAFYRRLKARLGAPKAITATAHKLARIFYRMLTTKAPSSMPARTTTSAGTARASLAPSKKGRRPGLSAHPYAPGPAPKCNV